MKLIIPVAAAFIAGLLISRPRVPGVVTGVHVFDPRDPAQILALVQDGLSRGAIRQNRG